MIARGYVNLQHIASEWNFADILTKHWAYQNSYNELIQPVFHHPGNTAALFLDGTLELDASIADGTIFGILGSEKRSTEGEQTARGGEHTARVCGKLNTISEE